MNSNDSKQEITIEFPIDMLWVDVDADDYMADDTETAYAEAVKQALWKRGYDATVTWSNAVNMEITDADGDDIADDRYSEICSIIDSVEVEYIEIEDES